MLHRFLCAVVALGLALPAQNPDDAKAGGDGDAHRDRTAKMRAAQMSEKGEKGEGEDERERQLKEEWDKLTPEERLQRSVTHGAGQHCRFVAAFKPEKLMPGQSGVLMVTAVLQGQAVLPAPAPLEVISAAQQGYVTIGAPAFRQAEAGKLAKGYLGRPVYDNTAVFEIPVQMAANAKLGDKQAVAVDMRFDLYDGSSAMPVGRFIDRVATTVEVGQVPDPAVAGLPAGQPRATTPATGAATPGVSGAGDTIPTSKPAVAPALTGTGPLGVNDLPSSPPIALPLPSASGAAPLQDAEGAIPLPLLIGGGALVLGVLALLLLRGRK